MPAAASRRTCRKLRLEELADLEIDSVYGASMYLQKVTEAPSSVTIITADDIERYGYRTLADILRSVRGFYITNDRNYSYLGVRGFSRPGRLQRPRSAARSTAIASTTTSSAARSSAPSSRWTSI